MKTIKLLFILLLSLNVSSIYGQHDGVKKDNNTYFLGTRNSPSADKVEEIPLIRKVVLTTDSTFIISARILMNLEAAGYKITIALTEKEKTVNQCNIILDEKINNLISEIAALGIKEDAIFIDMISQYPVYKYDVERKNATEYLEGYEINKNVIVRTESISQINSIVDIAAENEIYDVVKVDYIAEDLESLYDTLFSEAAKIINRKKNRYESISQIGQISQSYVKLEQFQIIFPYQLYKSYQAFEASDIEYHGYRSRSVQEKERKKKTVYFEGISYSGFDKYINSEKVEIGLQVIFELQIQYEFE